MKKYIIHTFILFSLFYINNSYAQRGERVKALKVAYITENLALTAEEAEKFWPIYNEFSKTRHELRNVELRRIKSTFKFDSTSEDEANEILDEIGKIEDKIYENRKNLVRNLRKSISPKKILLLKKVDADFNKQLLERLKQRKNKKMHGRQ